GSEICIRDRPYAVFEPSAELSVLPVGSHKPVAMEDVDNSKVDKAELTDVLIVDGAVSYSGLSEINKDVDWLFSRLNIKQKKDLQNIILAVYDDKQDKFNVHYKNQ
ncbi:MAG: DUF421 domain-containing protein, partial [Clostridiales bacterium]|nr:DUF421 domain-containing protein [Clostridiales bacterium]